MSQDSFAAALDAELFGSDDGAEDQAAAAAPAAGAPPQHGQSPGERGRAMGGTPPPADEGDDGDDDDDPFAALDAMEAAEEAGSDEEGAPAGTGDAAGTAAPERPASAGGCSHPGFMFGLCIRCGAEKPDESSGGGGAGGGGGGAGADRAGGGGAQPASNGGGGMRIKHLHARQALEVSAEEAARITAGAIPALLASRRLVLVLDLDHTLLNSVREADVSAAERPMLAEVLARQRAAANAAAAADARRRQEGEGQPDAAEGEGGGGGGGEGDPAEAGGGVGSQDVLPPSLGHWHPPLLFHLSHCRLWTKLRPGVREFLSEASSMYELHIYTMGDKAYAREIAGLLDPGGRLFAGRVVSASDSTKTHEKGLDVLLASEAHVLVLDDTEHVERYHFFGGSVRSWQPTANGLLEDRSDEDPASGMLATCLRVLRGVHEEFFAGTGGGGGGGGGEDGGGGGGEGGGDGNGGGGGGALKAPTKRRRAVSPFEQPLWVLAEALGADCSTRYAAGRTTHVVQAARRDGVCVVHYDWLLASKFRAAAPPARAARGFSWRPSDRDAAIARAAAGRAAG
ncbi:MAG: hypothetical protein J3K34DRAFT_487621 [Monoraphidium minutum]|nr:MAG: hypothetical protein J3K34DRAFT_487621 [Monoraphidium minutum]